MKKIIIANILIFITASSVFAACSVDINMGGNIINNVGMSDVNTVGEAATKTYVDEKFKLEIGDYNIRVNAVTGRTWLDRNLGAKDVCSSIEGEEDCLGSLYQWGRTTDGHQCARSVGKEVGCSGPSEVVDVVANEIKDITNFTSPFNGKFIKSQNNWVLEDNSKNWKGIDATFNPCPSGFRIPSVGEFMQEFKTWGWEINRAKALGSPLGLSRTDLRDNMNGTVSNNSEDIFLWTDTMLEDGRVMVVQITNDDLIFSAYSPSYGMGVRCIKR